MNLFGLWVGLIMQSNDVIERNQMSAIIRNDILNIQMQYPQDVNLQSLCAIYLTYYNKQNTCCTIL